ncbi:hypothetical protein [Streptomyces sp. NPDC006333]
MAEDQVFVRRVPGPQGEDELALADAGGGLEGFGDSRRRRTDTDSSN